MAVIMSRVLHFFGLIMVFLALGGALVHAINGGTREHAWKKQLSIMHGIGLVLVLVAGIGLTHALGMKGGWPGWVWAKIVVWLALGGITVPIIRRPELARSLWWAVLALGLLGVGLAVAKPF